MRPSQTDHGISGTVRAIDERHFRSVLGQYPTGVVLVTSISRAGEALGMTVGSFTSVSIDPPLIAFMPSRESESWKSLRASGDRFCINVLGAAQENVCRAIATRKTNKFHDIPWHASTQGMPIVEGAVAYIDCTVDDVYDAGDHHIVVGRVLDLDATEESAYPLLFFRGGYGSFSPLSLAAGDADLLEQLRLVDLARPAMESLAQRLETEVTANALVRNELVVSASAGRAPTGVPPTRVGARTPFMPPLGSVFAAWGAPSLQAEWIANLSQGAEAAAEQRRVLATVRQRGYAITLGHEPSARLERLSTRSPGERRAPDATLRQVLRDIGSFFNPAVVENRRSIEVRSLTAPVFNTAGQVAFSLTVWGPKGAMRPDEVDNLATELLAATSEATRIASGHQSMSQ